MSFTSSSIVNTLMPSWRYAWLDMIVQYHFIHMFCMFYGCRSTPVSTVNILSVVKNFQVEIQPISCLNDSETQERGLQGVNCKIQKIPCGSMPPNSPHWLEAFAFGTQFGKSVIIYPTSVPAIVDIKTFHRNNKHAEKSSSMPMYMYMYGCNFLDYFLHSCYTSAIP